MAWDRGTVKQRGKKEGKKNFSRNKVSSAWIVFHRQKRRVESTGLWGNSKEAVLSLHAVTKLILWNTTIRCSHRIIIDFNSCILLIILCVLSHIWLFVTLRTVAHQAPLSVGFQQARKLEWVAISSSRGSPWSRDGTCVFCIGGWILYHCPA